MTQRHEQPMSRGTLARRSGVNLETVRYYETRGLIPEPPRSAGGHRLYDEAHLKRLTFVRRCRELGFSLDEIRQLLGLVDGGDYTCADVLKSTRDHIRDIRRKIADLRTMEHSLLDLSERCSGERVPQCPIIDDLWPAG